MSISLESLMRDAPLEEQRPGIVAELLSFLAAHPSQDHGFVVRATEQSEVGVTLATGLDGGLPPRLDVYLE